MSTSNDAPKLIKTDPRILAYWRDRLSVDEEEIRRTQLHDWGFFHLTVPEAAKLATIDMWFEGEIPEVPAPEGFDGEPDNEELKHSLLPYIEKLTQRLAKSISNGLLRADLVGRDMDDAIIIDKTYISYEALVYWLSDRGYDIGEMGHEWKLLQEERAYGLASNAGFYRTASNHQIRALENARIEAAFSAHIGSDPDGSLENVYKAAVIEIDRLRRELEAYKNGQQSRVDRPLSTRQRRTLLTIISALCEYAAINPIERGAASRIAGLTDEIGAPVGSETITGLLKEIPDAVESRMK